MTLRFQFESVSAFLAMDSYWPYVWSCYGMAMLVITALAISGHLRRRRFFRIQQGILKRSEPSSFTQQ